MSSTDMQASIQYWRGHRPKWQMNAFMRLFFKNSHFLEHPLFIRVY